MNIDDLKDAWKHDEPAFTHQPISAAMQGKTISAVNKIRSNMKAEFISTLLSYPIFIWFLFFRQTDAFLFNITSLLFFTMLLLNTYYFLKFYAFYRSISRYDLNVKNSITKAAYELELNTEIYKAYNFCVTPIAIIIFFGMVCGKETSTYMLDALTGGPHNNFTNLLMIFGVLLVCFLGTYILITVHVNINYGKHLKELKLVINDLGEDAV